MGRPRYMCNACRKDFTRKWNATRHRTLQHQGLAEIIPLGEFLLRQSNHLNFLPKGLDQQRLMHDDHEEIMLDDTISKLAAKVEELEQLVSYEPNPRTRENFMGPVIMRALSSSDPIKKFDNELSSIRRGVKCAMVTNKVASCLGIQVIHADAMIKHLLSNSHRSRINRVMNP
ncbi:MAG TPA: hypothetical protein VH500_17910 [Nitrososphaeraceae archaeon]